MNMSPGVLAEGVTFRLGGRTLPSDLRAPSVHERLHVPLGPRGPLCPRARKTRTLEEKR